MMSSMNNNRLSSFFCSFSAAAPAFTPVATRRTLGQPVFVGRAPPNPPLPPPEPRKIDWPAPVREYVQRCFASENVVPGITLEEMQTKLKAVINEAAENNALAIVDWAALPLPQHLLQGERAQLNDIPSTSRWPENISRLTIDDDAVIPANRSNPKKRKSSEPINDDDLGSDNSQPPWRKVNPRNIFENRITYPNQAQAKRIDKRQRKFQDDTFAKDPSKSGDLEKRRQRFESGKAGFPSPVAASSRDDTPMPDVIEGPVIGTCRSLEKNYFRLTSAPKPETVRPLPVLRQTLALLKEKWKKDNNYSYICDQFKSLRQDLTVQHIKNEFTVNVYELHARIALERQDLGEYNQCQTQLRALFRQKLGGHPAEFLAYRILYFIHTCNRTDMNDVLAELTTADRNDTAVKHALEVRSALALGNYHRFFKLYIDVPNMGSYLMDMFANRERLAALTNICKA